MQRTTAALIAILMSIPLQTRAERRRAVILPDRDAVSIEFVEMATENRPMLTARNNAWIELGTVIKRDEREQGIHVRRQFGIRVVRPGGTQWGAARLTARLQTSDGRTQVQVDGRSLNTAPTLIDERATIGATITHRLDLFVPNQGTAGPIDASIVWEVNTDP